jgi:hypothetical protein
VIALFCIWKETETPIPDMFVIITSLKIIKMDNGEHTYQDIRHGCVVVDSCSKWVYTNVPTCGLYSLYNDCAIISSIGLGGFVEAISRYDAILT